MHTKEGKEGVAGLVKWFSELSNKDVSIAGGKGASLAEMYNHKFPIPPGFIITAQAYKYFIEKTGLDKRITEVLENLDVEDTKELERTSKKIREMMEGAEMPKELEDEIKEAYEVLDADRTKLEGAKEGALGILRTGYEPPFVAVRSSATAEDLADASFAGQQDSFLNVKGDKELLKKVKQCFSSLFTARAIYYRQKKGFAHDKVYLAAVVQRMVDSDKSGVMFSRNPIKDDGSIMIEAVYGLGEGIVSGMIKPDSYIVDKNLDEFKVKNIEVYDKKVAIVRTSSGKNEIVKLSPERSRQQVLNSYEIKRLALYGRQLEEHYKKPQDIEFAIEGSDIYIVQSRPITTKVYSGDNKEVGGEILLSGLGASPGVGSGVVKIISDLNDLDKIKKGDILVTTMTNPDMVVAMQRAAGIITDEGGVTSHASIVSREMGIPCIVGTGEATKKLKEGQLVTVDGNNGKVHEGKSEAREVEIKRIVSTKTKIKVIVDLPDYAERAAKSGAKAVGLVRLEGIIGSSGKHPLKYVKEKKMEDYVAVLVKGLKKIAHPFEEIWIRSSDIRSDEYRNLEGAPKDVEGNPMLGDHGIRFSLRHPEILTAELMAVKEIADEFPEKKIGIMAPQIISSAEVREMKRIAVEEVGIPKNVKIGIMVETPAAVQIINKLCEEGIQFVSFGTNDLTQFTLAIDRNNSEVQYLYDEMSPAVLNSIRYVIRRCKHYGVETSICGQAGSKPEMAKFLVREGIDSVSVNADAAFKVSEIIAEIEAGITKEPEYEGREEAVKELRKEKEESKKEFREEMLAEEGGARKAHHPIAVLPMQSSEKLDEDIQDIILRELETEAEKERQQGTQENEYNPGIPVEEEKMEIPSLNDAIPIDSVAFAIREEAKEIDLSFMDVEKITEKEWTGEATRESEVNDEVSEEKVLDIF